MSFLNLFFMYCAASSCWAGLQATISEHLRTSSGPRGRQQRPQPAGQMQHSPGNVWSSSVLVGDKIKESGVNLTWKKNEIEIIATIYLNSFKKSRQPNEFTHGPLKKLTEPSQELHILKIHSRGGGGLLLHPGAGWGLIVWTISFHNPKKFISKSFLKLFLSSLELVFYSSLT